MAKYKVCYSGFSFVEAESEEEAEEMFFDGNTIIDETGVDEIVEVEEFIWRI
jgi:hypothetical protein